MNDMVVMAVIGTVLGFITKIVWDWVSNRGKETQAVTTIIMERMSKDIEKILRNMDVMFERLRQLDLVTTTHCEKIKVLESDIKNLS